MNQPLLAQLVLAFLPKVLNGGSEPKNDQWFTFLATSGLASQALLDLLARDQQLFTEQGLAKLSQSRVKQLSLDYSVLLNEPTAVEITQWLAGEYAFDPNCLND